MFDEQSDPSCSLLHVRNLTVRFALRDGRGFTAVDRVEFSVHPKQTLAIVGESGCGKTVTGLSILRLVECPPGKIEGGPIRFDDRNLLDLSDGEMRRVRGREIAMIFQEPALSLNPVMTIGDQIVETVRLHRDKRGSEAHRSAVEVLSEVGMPRPEEIMGSFPHELSGGMCQRVMIAMAIVGRPRLLIADEPTTALDVTIQRQILQLLRQLRRDHGLAMLLVTHDLGIVAEDADVVAVMYGGVIVEYARVGDLFATPYHPYTRGLLDSVPRLDQRRSRLRSVAEVIDRPESFTAIPGHRFGVVPWWPEMKPPDDVRRDAFGSMHRLHEVSPGHWVRCWASPYVYEHPIVSPDIPYRRDDGDAVRR